MLMFVLLYVKLINTLTITYFINISYNLCYITPGKSNPVLIVFYLNNLYMKIPKYWRNNLQLRYPRLGILWSFKYKCLPD